MHYGSLICLYVHFNFISLPEANGQRAAMALWLVCIGFTSGEVKVDEG